MRIPTAIGFVAGSWLIGAAIYAVVQWTGWKPPLFIFYIPLVFAFFLFGYILNPSDFGFWAGMIVQWTVIGFVALEIYHGVQRMRAPVKRGEPFPTAIGFVAGSWLIGAAIYAVARWSGAEASLFIFFFFPVIIAAVFWHSSEIGLWVGMIVQWRWLGLLRWRSIAACWRSITVCSVCERRSNAESRSPDGA
jgi:hypothetical protein